MSTTARSFKRFQQQRNAPAVNTMDRVRVNMSAFVGHLKTSMPNISMVVGVDKPGQCWGNKKKKEPNDITVEVMLKYGEKNLFINPIVCLRDVVSYEGKVLVDNLYARRNEISTELQGSIGLYSTLDRSTEMLCMGIHHTLMTIFIGKRGRPKWSKPSDYFVYLSSISTQLARNAIVTSKGVPVLLGKTEAYAVTLTFKLQDGEEVELPSFIAYKHPVNPQVDPKKVYEAIYTKAVGKVSDRFTIDVLGFNINKEL